MIRIVTEGGANLPPELFGQLDIEVAEGYVMFGDEPESDMMDTDEFYRRLANNNGHVTTTVEPPADNIAAIYKKILDQTPRATILSIHVTGKLSRL